MAYPYKKGKGWYADWRMPNGMRKRKLMPNKVMAEQYEAQQKLKILRGEIGVVDSEPVTLKDFWDRYFRNHTEINKKKSSQETEPFIMVSVIKRFGHLRLKDITPESIEKFKAERRKVVAPATINRSLTLLSNIFNKAIEWGVINVQNPLRKVRRFKENNERVRCLSREEKEILLANVSGKLRDIILFALNTGMRRGEIINLRRGDINFTNNIIIIREQKNGETSYIPMNSACHQILAKYRDLNDSDQPFGYDFTSSFVRLIRDIRKKQLEKNSKSTILNDFHFHDLRHTFASTLVMSGVDLNTVRELMRHKSLKMTLRYTHLSSSFKQFAVERLDTYWTPGTLKGVQTENKNLRNRMQDKEIEMVGGTGLEPVTSTMSR